LTVWLKSGGQGTSPVRMFVFRTAAGTAGKRHHRVNFHLFGHENGIGDVGAVALADGRVGMQRIGMGASGH